MRTTVRRFLPVAVMAAFIGACADAPTSTVRLLPDVPSMHQIPVAAPQVELVGLCKAGPAGTYTFNATATAPILRNEAFVSPAVHNLTAATYTVTVTALSTINVGGVTVQGACYNFGANHSHIALASGGVTGTVTVVETPIPAGIDFDHVVVYQNTAGTVTTNSSTTNSASAQAGGAPGQLATLGANIVFYNVVEPPPPPPPATCGYTKGWYRNKNGSPTVIAVDGRSIAEAQAIFKATPGKPNGVSWGADNNNLNLYQQLLAALQNLDGDPLGGPANVDAAIAAALAGTGGSGLVITVAAGTDVSVLINTLSSFNEGKFAGFPHCGNEVIEQ